jgi:hypothetical protein
MINVGIDVNKELVIIVRWIQRHGGGRFFGLGETQAPRAFRPSAKMVQRRFDAPER